MPRIAPKAVGKYISKGSSFDIGTMDPDGNPWDFTKAKQRQKAREYIIKNKPLVIIGSPPCDQWSIMQNLNNNKRNPGEVHRKMIEARIHLAFCAELYGMQIEGNRYHIHEHPLTASSWQEPCLRKIIEHEHNLVTRIHMCAYNMKIPDKQGNEYIFKPTQFITNSRLIAAGLERKCDKTHEHARLQGNRTNKAAIYIPAS